MIRMTRSNRLLYDDQTIIIFTRSIVPVNAAKNVCDTSAYARDLFQ